jgi:hypothetical protein
VSVDDPIQTSSQDASADGTSVLELGAGGKLLLLACNCIPLLHLVTLGVLINLFYRRPLVCVSVGLVWLYCVPPLVCRLVMILFPLRREVIAVGSREFFVWWFTANLQVLFSRLPFLEELLRFIPGCYSFWLRLWGSNIGRLTYWAPGVRVLDRSFLRIGDNVTFGAGVLLNAHVLMRDDMGRTVLSLAPISVGQGTLIGGYSLLTAGAQIAAGQATRAFLILPPFTRVEQGRRSKRDGLDSTTPEHSGPTT